MKVLTFSQQFPPHHIRAGEPTHFIEKIWGGLNDQIFNYLEVSELQNSWQRYHEGFMKGVHKPKHHTIRKGNRWKVGDWASLRIWSGKPYRSKQVEFAQVEIKKVWDVDFLITSDGFGMGYFFSIYGSQDEYVREGMKVTVFYGGKIDAEEKITRIALNDGLQIEDFISWFSLNLNKRFKGQIICWADDVEY